MHAYKSLSLSEHTQLRGHSDTREIMYTHTLYEDLVNI